MLILAVALLVALGVWLLAGRGRTVHPVVRTAALAGAVLGAAAVASRAGPVASALAAAIALTLGLWLRGGGGGGGGGGPGPPGPPDPDPGSGRSADLPAEVLDPDALDCARAEWERELSRRG